jgi:hypothetical protein
VDVDEGPPAALANGLRDGGLGPPHTRLVAGKLHQVFPLAAVGSRAAPVKKPGRDVRGFVADHLA